MCIAQNLSLTTSVASAGRRFIVMKIVKNFNRSTTFEERLNKLSIVHLNCDFAGAVDFSTTTKISKNKAWEAFLNVGWFEVLTAVTMKMAVVWVVVLCRLVSVYRRFRGLYCLYHRCGVGGSTHHWNVGKLILVYTALILRRQPSLFLK
jgi:hypothetical protein